MRACVCARVRVRRWVQSVGGHIRGVTSRQGGAARVERVRARARGGGSVKCDALAWVLRGRAQNESRPHPPRSSCQSHTSPAADHRNRTARHSQTRTHAMSGSSELPSLMVAELVASRLALRAWLGRRPAGARSRWLSTLLFNHESFPPKNTHTHPQKHAQKPLFSFS